MVLACNVGMFLVAGITALLLFQHTTTVQATAYNTLGAAFLVVSLAPARLPPGFPGPYARVRPSSAGPTARRRCTGATT